MVRRSHTRTQEIKVPGGLITASHAGDGPPILLIHSATVDRRSWDGVVPHLVDAGYRAVWYDLRGFGESTTEDVDFAGEHDLLAVLDALGIERVAAVGNSMGAIFALDAILEAPTRFVAFIWLGGGIGGFRGTEDPNEAPAFAAARLAHEGDDLDAMTEWNLRIWLDGVGQSPTRVPADVREKVRVMNRPLVEKARILGILRRPDPAAATRLGEITVPITAIVGDLDTRGIHEAARLLATRAGAKLITLAGVAHLPGMEIPEKVADLIIEHVRTREPWA